jgi:hypothetical protein
MDGNNRVSVSGASLSATSTIMIYTVFLPEFTDVKRQTPGRNPDFADDVRFAEIMAASTSLGVALLVAHLESSWTPILAWAAVSILLTLAYEFTLQVPGTQANLVSMTS